MEFSVDPDVKAVAEFMQRNIAASKLVPVANAVAAMAPNLWGHHGSEPISPMILREPSSSARGPHTQSDTSGSPLVRACADGGSVAAIS